MQYFGFDRPSFGIKTYGFGANFDPLYLFAGGKQGAWYDPSDKSTLFQDVGGASLPVTKDGDPVGLMLDKSQGLEGAVTNVAKPFIADSSSSIIDITNTSEGTKIVYKELAGALLNIFEVGKTYKLSVVYSIPETANNINVYNAGSGVTNFLFTATKGVRNKTEVTLTARHPSIYFRSYSGEITIHEIVLKEIKGNHATQTVSTARPIYKTDGNLHWLEFDGADDYMQTTTKHLPEWAVYTASSVVTTSSTAVIFGSRSSITTRSYIGHLNGQISAGVGSTSNSNIMSGIVYVSNTPVVGVYFHDGVSVRIRQDGVDAFLGEQVGDVIPSAVGYVGALNDVGSPASYLKGKLYGILAVNSVDASSSTESYLAKKSGVTL